MNKFKKILILCSLLFSVLLSGGNIMAQKATKISTNRYGLKLKINKVEAFDRKVVIDGVFQNNDDYDMGINVRNYWSTAFDDEGNRYAGDNITFSLGSGNMGSAASSTIPAGASLKMRIIISGVPEAANYIDYIKIDTYPETDKNIIIRNLPIYREGDE